MSSYLVGFITIGLFTFGCSDSAFVGEGFTAERRLTGGPSVVPEDQPKAKNPDGTIAGSASTSNEQLGVTKDGIQSKISEDSVVVADRCDKPKGSETASVLLGGEDVFGNGWVGGPDGGAGSDFDDFLLSVTGRVVVDRQNAGNTRLGIAEATTLEFSYIRGSSDCYHSFEFIVRKCPNEKSTTISKAALSPATATSASTSLQIPQGNVFLDILMKVDGNSPTRRHGGCKVGFSTSRFLYNSSEGDKNIMLKPALILMP